MYILICLYKRSLLKLYISILFYFSFLISASSQNQTFGNNFNFVNYLLKNNLNKEALYALDNLDTTNFKIQQYDSLYYNKGYCNFKIENYLLSKHSFLKVSKHSDKYELSVLQASFNAIQLKNYTESSLLLDSVNFTTNDTIYMALKNLQKAGIALLNRNLDEYKYYQEANTALGNSFITEKKRLKETYNTLLAHKNKSPFVAGLMSAVLPGSGKWYAGKKGQGLSSFFTVLVLGLLTHEAYTNGGIKSVGCIGYGSLLSLFYVGNIWGSVATVKTSNKEFNQLMNNEIMVSLKLPFGYIVR